VVTRSRRAVTPVPTIPFHVDMDILITDGRWENLVESLFGEAFNSSTRPQKRRRGDWTSITDAEYDDLNLIADWFSNMCRQLYRALSPERRIALVKFLVFSPVSSEKAEDVASKICEFVQVNELYWADFSNKEQDALAPFLREFIAAARPEINKIRAQEASAEAKRAQEIEKRHREMVSELQGAGFTVLRPRSPTTKKAKA
jgi:hypothetical protein